MPANRDVITRCRGWQAVARRALAAVACMALASCGSGPGSGHPDLTVVFPDAVRGTAPDAPAASLPDLVLEPPEVSNAGPASGDEFTLSVRVRNAGSATAVTTAVRFHRSADEAITPSDPEVGTVTVVELTASGTRVASVELTAPSRPATYYYGACVDAVNGQTDTTDNCSAPVRVTVREPQTARPDLAVAQEVRMVSAEAGKYLRIPAEVYNAGDAAAAATRVNFYRSTDSTITRSDDLLDTARVPELAPSRRVHVAGATLAPITPGTYYYGACVDAVPGESDTTNNCRATQRATVRLGSPDLAVFLPSLADPVGAAIGGRFSLRVTVHKIWGGSGVISLRCYRSDDAKFTTPGTQVGFLEVRDMAPFSVMSMWMHLDAPSNAGTYHVRVCADTVAGETDTTNNCSSPVQVVVSDD
ncbi:MAG: hypothetical protein OXP69_09765 [Spirochaetaceae bacterium]|nr:hypothetical protein [Spirochaetaceae bacterium]